MNIYCFSTLSFAKLQFKSVINKAFHKHGVASFTDAWIETNGRQSLSRQSRRIFYRCVDWNWHWCQEASRSCQSHLLQMRGLKHLSLNREHHRHKSHLLQMRGLKLESSNKRKRNSRSHLLQMRGLKRLCCSQIIQRGESHLLQMRGLKPRICIYGAGWILSHLLQMRGLKRRFISCL